MNLNSDVFGWQHQIWKNIISGHFYVAEECGKNWHGIKWFWRLSPLWGFFSHISPAAAAPVTYTVWAGVIVSLRSRYTKLYLWYTKIARGTTDQGIDSVPRIISTACYSNLYYIACYHLNFRDNSRYGVNTLGPLCLWQCFLQISSTLFNFFPIFFSTFI